jgi:hypothetical protein
MLSQSVASISVVWGVVSINPQRSGGHLVSMAGIVVLDYTSLKRFYRGLKFAPMCDPAAPERS